MEKLIPKIIILANQNLKVPIYGKGNNIRDWIFVDDHCDAVKLALPKIKSKYFFLIWADQLGISYKTMLNSLNFFLSNKKYAVIFPTIKKIKPYTLVIKNKLGNVTDVIQSRETKITKTYGETDCGFFVCNTMIINTFIKKLILN